MEIKDSGQRRIFSTGSQRDVRDGKGRFDLLPARAIKRLAQHYEAGAKKYNPRNWEKGQHLSTYMDSGLRHAFSYMANEIDEDHLAAACWNLMCCIETQERIKLGILPDELGDLPNLHLI